MKDKTKHNKTAGFRPPLFGASIFLALAALVAFSLVIFREIAFRKPAVAEYYTTRIFSPLASVWAWPFSQFSFSLTELLVVIGTPVLLLLLILGVVRLFTNRACRLRRLLRSALVILGTICILLSLFLVFHGLNYARPPLAAKLDLPLREHSVDELEEAVRQLARAAVQARQGLPESNDGTVDIGPLNSVWKAAFDGWDQAAARWPALGSPVRARPKGVLLSHYWSYTHIVGLYMPFFIEPNVNIDQPAFMIASTTAHEISHSRGFASEGDSDFAAFLSCVCHPDPVWRYSGLISAWKSAAHRLWEEDRDRWSAAYREELSPAIIRDLQAESLYWEAFETPVADFSEQVNDAYLKANNEGDGVKSYGAVVDLLLAWLDTTDAELIFSQP
ncbi:MAG: DUF3810 domain-containing protein [Clostridiaceae bacterium]|nr:DUF3810 domain-containing protein [Clostridiaceae bacterium]